jgi:hypothetical protein
MSFYVAGAIVGSAVIGGISSNKAARTQAEAAERAAETGATGAVRVAEIEAESNERAADLQAQGYLDAARELELGAVGAGGIEFPTSRAPGTITPAELNQFNEAVATGRFDDAARLATATGVSPETVTQYINANLAGLNLPEPVTQANVNELMSRAQTGQFNEAVATGRFDEAARIAISTGAAPETVTQYINANLAGLNLPEPVTQANVSELMSRAQLEGGGIRAGTEIEARAAERAAGEVAGGETRATLLQKKRMDEALTAQQNLLSPYSTAGKTAVNRLSTGLATGGEFAKPFTLTNFTADPGYAFRLSEGQKALERQSAARGGLMSGGALKAATRFGQEMGSQEFQNAFNRYYAERGAQLDPLFQLYSGGLAASGDLATAEGTAGRVTADYLGAGETGAARARAQGMLSAGAARSSGYLEELDARSRAARELAAIRASAYTGPAAFTAEGIRGAGSARAGGVRESTAATSAGLLRAGEARAAGTMGVANALSGGVNTGLNYYQNQQLLNRLAPSPTSSINITSNPTMGATPYIFGVPRVPSYT